jgi:pyridoxal phosphate enzyme (YggS family)
VTAARPAPADVAARLAAVEERIAAAGGHEVAVVALTKGFPAAATEAAVAAGCRRVGENYAQELLPKLADVTGARPEVHFIGHLQSRKVKPLAGVVDVWQSIDRASLLDPLARCSPGARIMVQVNITDEPQKGGCPPGEAAELVARARDAGLDVEGLMAIGRFGPPEGSRAGFRVLRTLADQVGVRHCSMGMSEDLEVAVAEGSTMVRVGTALFGHRPPVGDAPK